VRKHTNAQVCHLWAHQAQEHARSNNGNVSFHGRDLYSYSTVIATIVDDTKGNPVALVTSHGYSKTTGKQKGNVYRALGYGTVMPEFTVPFLGKPGGMASYEESRFQNNPAALHGANAKTFLESFHDNLARYKRARKQKEWITSQVRDAAENYNRYVALFGVGLPCLDFEPLILAAVAERIKTEEAKNTPEYRAKLEKDRASRLERERRDFREVRGKFKTDWREPGGRDEDRFTEEDRVARSDRLTAMYKDKVESWLAGETHICPRLESALLRIKSNVIQTSWGATFPIEHGIKAFPVIARCRNHRAEWHTNGHSIHLGAFRIDSISAEGDVRAGCHTVKWEAIERIARELGLI
jgi:hypothetical protein